MNNLQSNLRFLRKKYKYTQTEISKKLNISRSTFSNYEQGQSEPDLNMLIKICDLFNCSLDKLVTSDLSNTLNQLDEQNLSFNEINYSDLLNENIDINCLFSDLNKLKKNYLSDKKELTSKYKKYILSLDNKIDKVNIILDILKNSNNEYSKELIGEINTKSKLNSSNLCNSKHSNVVGFLDKLKSKRNEQVVDCKSNDYINESMPKINLLGQVSAGYPNLAYEDRNTFVKVPNSLLCSSKEYFILQVSGDSMDKIYSPNELLLIEKTNVANNGDMVIALIGTDECTLKEYEKINDTIYLIPHSTNQVHKTQEYDINEVPCHVIGVVKNILEGATIFHESI